MANEITACYIGLKLVEFGDDDGYEFLRKFGITYTDEKDIKSAILRKETKLELLRNKMAKKDSREVRKFYDYVDFVESKLNRQLNIGEINLERWIAYLKRAIEIQEMENKSARNNKK